MKSLTTVAAGMLAAFLVFAPALAYAATTTVTVSTDKPAYRGAAAIAITGTVSPAPGSGTSVSIKITNPGNTAVFVDSQPVTAGTGAFSSSTVAGGTNWITGTYRVTATWGTSPSTSFTGTTTFSYTGVSGVGGVGANVLNVNVQASTPDFAGDTVQVGVTVYWTNGSLASVNNFPIQHYVVPGGASEVPLGTATMIHKGSYEWSIPLSASAAPGLYLVHVQANASGIYGFGAASWTVNPSVASSSQIRNLNGTVTAFWKATAASIASIQASLTTLGTKVDGLTSSLGTLTTNVQTSFATLSTKIDNDFATLQSSISGSSSSLNASVAALNAKVSNLQTAVGNNQTYVIVVAALAAITLVLELAILIRKLS
jgi:hypothetical protein